MVISVCVWIKFIGCFFNYNISIQLENKKKSKGKGMKRKKTVMPSALPKFMEKC